jgi:hypothetical protein
MRYLRREPFEHALEFEMAKRNFKRSVCRITAHAMIRYLSPAACWQTNIRPVKIRE